MAIGSVLGRLVGGAPSVIRCIAVRLGLLLLAASASAQELSLEAAKAQRKSVRAEILAEVRKVEGSEQVNQLRKSFAQAGTTLLKTALEIPEIKQLQERKEELEEQLSVQRKLRVVAEQDADALVEPRSRIAAARAELWKVEKKQYAETGLDALREQAQGIRQKIAALRQQAEGSQAARDEQIRGLQAEMAAVRKKIGATTDKIYKGEEIKLLRAKSNQARSEYRKAAAELPKIKEIDAVSAKLAAERRQVNDKIEDLAMSHPDLAELRDSRAKIEAEMKSVLKAGTPRLKELQVRDTELRRIYARMLQEQGGKQ